MKSKKPGLIAVVVGFFSAVLAASAFAADAPNAAAPEDRLDVIQLSSKYAWGIDTLDRNLLATVFSDNAVADYVIVGDSPIKLNEHLVGFDAIFTWLSKSLGHRKGIEGFPWHFVTNHIVEMQGDTAELRFYMHNRTMAAGGVYRVHAIRTPQGWRVDRLRLEEQMWHPDLYMKK